MKKFLLLLIIPLTLLCQQDEKRLALVIGNANYDKGPLNNPVNDARLIASTLEKLDFDVILKENIETFAEFKNAVFEFGDKREFYDVALVYYAGHGIQIGSQNYLLPTKVNFDTEKKVKFFGLNVNDILIFLNSFTDQVNILVLDACRDNPFEGNWNKTRSIGKGSGLAKIPPPSGSLIAFSTDAGDTAADGDGENSIYCKSLSKNLLKEDISLEQVFKNVRKEVEEISKGEQSPVENSKLTNGTFYFKKPKITASLKTIDKFILNKDFKKGLDYCNTLLKFYPNSSKILTKRAHLHLLLDDQFNALIDYSTAIEINPYQFDAYFTQIVFENNLEDCGIINTSAISTLKENYLNQWVKLDSLNAIAFQEQARYYNWELNKTRESVDIISKALDVLDDSRNFINSEINYITFEKDIINGNYLFGTIYINQSYIYESLSEIDLALKSVDMALKYDKKHSSSSVSGWSYYQKASLFEMKGDIKKALKYYKVSVEKMPDEGYVYMQLGKLYNYIKNYDEALKFFNLSIDLDKNRVGYAHLPLLRRAIFNYSNGKLYFALEDLYKLDFLNEFEGYSALIKFLIYKDLEATDLAFRELKKYLVFFDFPIKDFNDLDLIINVILENELPLKKFYFDAYPDVVSIESQINSPWNGKSNLNDEIITFIKNFN